MMDRTKMDFPMDCGFVSETGLYWNFRIWEDGSIDGMWRRGTKECAGGWKEIDIRSKVTKDCLKAVEKQFGLRTDGSKWID